MRHPSFFNLIKDFVKKQKLFLSLLLLLMVFGVVYVFILKDPLNLRYKNEKMNLSPKQVEVSATSVAKICKDIKAGSKQECYEAQLALVTKKYGLANSQEILSSLQDKDQFTRSCHLISHYMSHEAYLREPDNFFNLINVVDVNACGGGFLHGLLQGYSGDHPEIPINGEFAAKICEQNNDSYRISSCIHFIGHIFILRTNGDLPKALELCLSIKLASQFNCYDGVFMEDHQKVMLSDHDIMPLPTLDEAYFNSMENTCRKYTGEAGKACWMEMGEMYAHAYGYIPDIIFNDCNRAPTDEYAKICYSKGVVAMAVYPGFESIQKLLSLCSYYLESNLDYSNCTYTLLSDLIYNSPKFTSRGVALCSHVRQEDSDMCFRHLDSRLKSVIPDKAERTPFCNLIPGGYKIMCLR